MKLTINRTQNGEIEVYGALIRGCDWILIRKPGQGTYARIAGPTADSDDEEIIIEEYSDPENRKIWDELTDQEVAEMAYEEQNNVNERTETFLSNTFKTKDKYVSDLINGRSAMKKIIVITPDTIEFRGMADQAGSRELLFGMHSDQETIDGIPCEFHHDEETGEPYILTDKPERVVAHLNTTGDWGEEKPIYEIVDL